jgi:hypothetical protein
VPCLVSRVTPLDSCLAASHSLATAPRTPLTAQVFGLLAFEVTYTLLHYGTSYPTWRTPFAQLVVYGSSSKSASGPTSGGIGHNAETGAMTTGGAVYSGPGRTGGSEAVPMSNVGAPATGMTTTATPAAAPSHTQIEEPAHAAATPTVHA